VTVFTNYPAWAASRFGLPRSRIRSFTAHGLLTRAVSKTTSGIVSRTESWLHRMFGRWAAREVGKEPWDVIHCWSGVSEELLAPSRRRGVALLMRGSAHIAVQSRLLEEEEGRADVRLDRPSAWMIGREVREYALADEIVVLSTFAKRTFEEQGVPSSKLAILPLGVDVQSFRPSPDAIARRQHRVRAGHPLNVLYVGALSYQKGLFDLARVVEALSGEPFRFVLVGPITREAESVVGTLRGKAEIVGKVPQHELPALYARADLFVFPTIQDGFGMVLTQAKAAGLPILTTPNSAALDLVTPDEDGWIVPIRDGAALAQRLRWCHDHREVVADMTQRVYDRFQPRDWARVAADFEETCEQATATGAKRASHG